MSGSSDGVEIELIGRSSEVLEIFAEEVRHLISDISGIKDVNTSLEAGEEEINVNVHRGKGR